VAVSIQAKQSHTDCEKQPGKPTGRLKVLWIREPYLTQILAGRKTVEVRVGYENIRRLQPGDRLKLNDQHLATVQRVGRYASFEELLDQEDSTAIAPALAPRELLGALRELYPPEKEALGAVALEIDLRRYDAVLFDMGHTLVYFDPPETTVFQMALRDAGIERSVEEIGAAVQFVWGEYYRDAATATFAATPDHDHKTQLWLLRGLLNRLGLRVDDEVLESYEDLIDFRFSQPGVMRPFPEVADVLAALQERDYRLGIVSNWSWNLRDRVAQVALDGVFEIVWASAYAGCNKPHPGIFFQALVQMDLSAGRTLYVGDSYAHDIVGARSAGLDVALLDREGKAGEPDCPVIRDLWGLFDLLRE
jgi:HAD superfamily hydrolase (TIGR01662 family)